MFENKKPDYDKLLNYGFKKEQGKYLYKTDLLDGEFSLTVCVTDNDEVTTEVVEVSTGELYMLHLVEGANGAFVGKIREEYETVLQAIEAKCFEMDVFKSPYTKQVIEFARKEYGDEPEYLWEKFPDNAVLRRKDTSKWYAAILTVKKEKLGLEGSEKVEVIDLRMNPQEQALLIDNKTYFAGYHMNKKHWLTIVLDGSVGIDEIYSRIRTSYSLAVK